MLEIFNRSKSVTKAFGASSRHYQMDFRAYTESYHCNVMPELGHHIYWHHVMTNNVQYGKV